METRSDSLAVSATTPIDRRRLLAYAAASGLALAFAPLGEAEAATVRSRRNGPWSSRSTWGGRVPKKGDSVVVGHDVTLGKSTRVGGLTITPGGRLVFSPQRSVSLVSRRNVVVRGRLVMRPANAGKRHRLVFAGVREGNFKGGGMQVIAGDIGLWVMDRGAVSIAGAEKTPWLRANGSIGSGDRNIELSSEPTGWRVGDEVAITPTGRPTSKSHYDAFSRSTISAISGRSITLSRGTAHAHPAVDMPGGRATAEVLNLSRNVFVGGEGGGRAHVFVHSSKPQTIRNAVLRYLGPRKGGGKNTEPVAGRYGLHFHHCHGGSRGSDVHNVVVRDCGNHSFVPHMSHGVRFTGCIAFNVFESAFWWDHGDTTHNTLYQRCVAARVKGLPNNKAYRLTGFFLARGDGNRALDCVATGIWGASEASGFQWPGAKSEGIWDFTDCVAHNNKENGIFVWQNSSRRHVIERFAGFHNGRAGIRHGAYINGYVYVDSVLHGNLLCAIDITALSSGKRQLHFLRMVCDCDGLSDHAVISGHHILQGAPVLFEDIDFRNYKHSAFGFTPNKSKRAEETAIVDCSFDGNELWLYDNTHKDSLIRFRSGGQSLAVRPRDATQSGDVRSEWNAKVDPLEFE